MPIKGISSSPPNTALSTNKKSPVRSVFSMLPDGIRNASTRYDRSTIQISNATPIALSQAMASSFTVFGGAGGFGRFAEEGGGWGGFTAVRPSRSEEHT